MNLVDFSGAAHAPSKVVCVGRNYLEHIQELRNSVPDQMVLFFKPNASIASGLRARDGEALHYEGEICFAWEAGAVRYVGFGLDLTKRALQDQLRKKGLPWERSKAFRGAALFTSFVRFDGPADALRLELWIDGRLAQSGGVAEMIHKPEAIFDEVASLTDLEDFDIVMTGTPKGVGPVPEGAFFEGILFKGDQELVRRSWKANA